MVPTAMLSTNGEMDQDMIDCILCGVDLNRILYTSLDKSPKQMEVVGSSKNKSLSTEVLVPLETSHRELWLQESSCSTYWKIECYLEIAVKENYESRNLQLH